MAMKKMTLLRSAVAISVSALAVGFAVGQGGPVAPAPATRPAGGGFGGPGGFGGMGQRELPVVAKFDANKDGWLNAEERKLAHLLGGEVRIDRDVGQAASPGGFSVG